MIPDRQAAYDARRYNRRMDENILPISIRLARQDELAILQAIFSPNDFAGHHAQRFRVQAEGKDVYLIA